MVKMLGPAILTVLALGYVGYSEISTRAEKRDFERGRQETFSYLTNTITHADKALIDRETPLNNQYTNNLALGESIGLNAGRCQLENVKRDVFLHISRVSQ